MLWMIACGGGIDGTGVIDSPAGSGSGKRDAAVDGGPMFAAAKAFCVSETNRYRAMNSKPALTERAQLETYADTGAMVDYTSNSPHSHFSSTQGGGIAFAENECPGHSGWHLPPGGDMSMLVGQCVAAFFSEGPGSDYNTHGHYINMMGNYGTLGCGIYQSGNDVTIIQDYGQ